MVNVVSFDATARIRSERLAPTGTRPLLAGGSHRLEFEGPGPSALTRRRRPAGVPFTAPLRLSIGPVLLDSRVTLAHRDCLWSVALPGCRWWFALRRRHTEARRCPTAAFGLCRDYTLPCIMALRRVPSSAIGLAACTLFR